MCGTLEKMIDEADANYEVTLHTVMRRARVKVSERTVSNALHSPGYRFRKLRSKMILTPDDVKQRFAWATEHKGKSAEWFKKNIHIHLDNHHFKAATTVRGRRILAKRRVRGVYRTKGKSLRSGHVKPDPKLRVQTGSKGVLKMGGVGSGQVLVWHTIRGAWSGAQAASAYADVAAPALKKAHPQKRKFAVLEDNDPTGNRSKLAIAAKQAHNIRVFSIPKRSPDLNVLDYAISPEVEKRMRQQERKMSTGKRETLAQFEQRLDRTAASLSPAFVDRAIGNLHTRCQKLYEAKGGLFEEGGARRQ